MQKRGYREARGCFQIIKLEQMDSRRVALPEMKSDTKTACRKYRKDLRLMDHWPNGCDFLSSDKGISSRRRRREGMQRM